jgi:hypothetical protein
MYQYYGPEATFYAYRDVESGKTLTAVPGEKYDIAGPDPVPPNAFFVEVPTSAGADLPDLTPQLDRMTDESGVDHTESE